MSQVPSPYSYPPPGGMPPVPGAPWGYRPAQVGRPGVLTAIGVISLIVASISMLAGFGVGGFGLMVRRVGQMARVQASAAAASARVAGQAAGPGGAAGGPTILGAPDPAATSDEPEVGPQGMEAPDRRVVATALEQVEAVTPDQLRQLDRILATAGRQILPGAGAGTGLTVRDIHFAIRDHGDLLSDDPKDPDPLHFDFSTGQLQLHADRALFRAADRSVIRSSAPRPATGPAGDNRNGGSGSNGPRQGEPGSSGAAAPDAGPKASNDPFAPDADSSAADPTTQPGSAAGPGPFGGTSGGSGTALNAAQVQTVLQKVQAASGNKLNPAQLATLRGLLQAPNQQLVPAGMVWSPVSMAMVQPDGSVWIKLSGGYLFLDPQGTVTSQSPNGLPTMAVNPLSMMLVLGETVASLALAVLLMVAGILVLRQSPSGRRLHLVYALAKIPLATAGGLGIVWLGTGLAGTFGSGSGGGAGGPPPEALGWGIALGLGGLIYPVALLIALHTRAVRDYYRATA